MGKGENMLRFVSRWTMAGLAATVAAGLVEGAVVPERSSPIAKKEFRHPSLHVPNALQGVDEQAEAAAATLRSDLAALGVAQEHAFLDARGGRWGTLLPVEPLLPGTGDRNDLTWDALSMPEPDGEAAWKQAAWTAFVGYLERHQAQLRIDPGELRQPGSVAVHEGGTLVQINAPRVYRGVPVRDSYLTAVINHGNLVLFGAHNWGTISLDSAPSVGEVQAAEAVARHVAPVLSYTSWRRPSLAVVPLARGAVAARGVLDRGYDYRLVWVLGPAYEGELGRFEALVDAHSGELLAFVDTNQYQSVRRVQGGVYPVSNDLVPPDGTEQPGWPFPHADVATGAGSFFTDTGGNLPVCATGNITSTLNGRYVRMNDNCGAISQASAADLDFGVSGGTNCTVPAGASPGNTHASRTGFYELNKIAEQARGQLPGNAWLQQQLTSNMNINLTCNAFWNGATVNFYRQGGGCNNTGEIAAIFDHEWGHGMDNNDVNPAISNPGEGIADIYMALRLKESCVGRNFRNTNCGGYGNPCLSCTGVRDIDWAQRALNQPTTITWIDANCGAGPAPCGGGVHCEGSVYAESLWDLFNRDLPAIYGMSQDTALEVATRMTYTGAGPVGNVFQCVQGSGGCPATAAYLNYLAADDDNGNITSGTPHMAAIFSAFNRHGIACPTPVAVTSGCAGAPGTAPTVTGTAGDRTASLSWSAVSGAVKYRVFRTEGVFGCNFGKVLVGETYGTTFVDTGLQNGRAYYYTVGPVGLSSTCLGPLSSCTTVTPVAGANLTFDPASLATTINTGDGDVFLDNCETATVGFNLANVGSLTQTNVRINAVQPLTHPAMPITGTSAPVASVAACASAPASFSFRAVDLAADAPVRFRVDVTSDQLFPAVRSQVVAIEKGSEADLQFFATRTFNFESDAEGWQAVTGTFGRTNAAPGGTGGAGTFYFQSSSFLDNQCDEVQSPMLSLTATSTLSLQNNYDIEPFSAGSWYDRANVARVAVGSGARTVVAPNGGRPYNASGPGGVCGLDNQQGWAAANPTWGASAWDATALGSASVAGQLIRLNVKYGTDGAANAFGFRFDQLTLTDVNLSVADAQTNTCTAGNGAPVAVPDGSTTSSLGLVTVPVLANDSDPDGNCLRVSAVSVPANGAAFVNFVGCGTDTVSYVPNLSCGSPCNDSFQYTVSDGQGGTATAAVTIQQTPVELQQLSIE